jgi:transposase InsO family protein
LPAVYDAVIERFGGLAAHVAHGIALHHDWGPQYRSAHFLGSITWLGIAGDAAFLGEPETNGCDERWICTLKGAVPGAQRHDQIESKLTNQPGACSPPRRHIRQLKQHD